MKPGQIRQEIGRSFDLLEPKAFAWTILFLLLPVAALNYLDRQMLAAMKFSIMGDIPSIASEAHWGFLPASFKWVYAFLSPVGGYLADRIGRQKVIAGSLVTWSAVTLATGHVHSFETMVVTRALMGISEACYIPAALALIADLHPGTTRSRAVGFHQMAIYVGIILGGFSGYVADSPAFGWRWAFSVAGVVGILYTFPLYYWLRLAPAVTPVREERSVSRSTKALLTNTNFILLVAYFTLPALAAWVVKDWMPAILKQEFGIGQGKAGVSATLYVNLASLAGAALGGWLADRWFRRSIRGRLNVSILGMCVLVPTLFGIGNASSLLVAIVFLIGFGLGYGFVDCNNMPILCQIVRPEMRAFGYGIMNMASVTIGGFADWGFGIMRDASMPLNVIFGFFASACIVSAIIGFCIRPKTLASDSIPDAVVR